MALVQATETRYFGRNSVVSCESLIRQSSIQALKQFLDSIDHDNASSDSNWSELKDDLLRVHYFISSQSNDSDLRLYRLDLLDTVILPYLKSMKSRIILDKDRYGQVKNLLRLISNTTEGENSAHDIYHVLDEADRTLSLIESKRSFFQSELGKKLKLFLSEQWKPIIRDHKNSLRRIGGILLALGMAEIIGRPAAILYPLGLLLSAILKISQQLEKNNHTVNPSVIVDAIKALLLMFVASKAVAMIDMYTGLGYSCCLMGVASVFISSNDELVKSVAPVFSPHLASIEYILTRINEFEMNFLKTATQEASTKPSREMPLRPVMIHVESGKTVSAPMINAPRSVECSGEEKEQHINEELSNNVLSDVVTEEIEEFEDYVFADREEDTTSSTQTSSQLRKRK